MLGVGDFLCVAFPPVRVFGADKVGVGCEQGVAERLADQ